MTKNESLKILVTGSSSGIGEAVAKRLLEEGHQVLGLARRAEDAHTDQKNYIAENCDFSNLDALPEQLRALTKNHSDVDGIVCCAGKGNFGCLEEFSYVQMRELMELNFLSQAYVARAFIPVLKRSGKGTVIFMGSEAALEGSQKGSLYCASKFALRGFAQSLREECSRAGIRVGIINPGMVKSPFFQDLNFAPGEQEENYLLPEDVADAVHTVLFSRPTTVIDEINLSPLKKVVQFRK